MGVTKNGGYSAGSLETEQRNMSEHDFFEDGMVPPRWIAGAPPREKSFNYFY